MPATAPTLSSINLHSVVRPETEIIEAIRYHVTRDGIRLAVLFERLHSFRVEDATTTVANLIERGEAKYKKGRFHLL